MNRSGLLVNEPHCVPNHEIKVSQVHAFAVLVEAKGKPDGQAAGFERNLFIGTRHMLEMMRENIHELELQRLSAPLLTDLRGTDAAFFRRAINRMEDRNAG